MYRDIARTIYAVCSYVCSNRGSVRCILTRSFRQNCVFFPARPIQPNLWQHGKNSRARLYNKRDIWGEYRISSDSNSQTMPLWGHRRSHLDYRWYFGMLNCNWRHKGQQGQFELAVYRVIYIWQKVGPRLLGLRLKWKTKNWTHYRAESVTAKLEILRQCHSFDYWIARPVPQNGRLSRWGNQELIARNTQILTFWKS